MIIPPLIIQDGNQYGDVPLIIWVAVSSGYSRYSVSFCYALVPSLLTVNLSVISIEV